LSIALGAVGPVAVAARNVIGHLNIMKKKSS
jgi:hypothetical protein